MAKKGVSKISGNTTPVIGEKTTYQVSEWYAGTTAGQRNSSMVTWELFKKRRNGTFTTTHIRKKGVNHFTFGQVAAGETYRLEAYLFHPEGRGLLITPKPAAVPKIKKVELLYVDNTRGSVFSFFEKLRAQATCVNMLGKELVFTLWEDDKTGPGHDAGNQPIESKKAKVNKNGIAVAEFALTAALMRQAAKGELDSQLEFYVTVEYYAHKKHATNNVHVANPYYTAPATNPAPAAPKPEQNLPSPAAPAPATPAKEKEENKKDVPQTQPTDSQQASGTATVDQPPTNPIPDGKSDAVVKETKIEGIIDAYFAKKDFTKLTGQEAGNYTYTFGGKKAANNTSNAANKEKVANAILSVGKVNEKLKTEKKYTTKEAIVSALTAPEYGTDTTSHKTVTFKTFALGEEFKKIGSAPLEDKVYLVVSTYLLEGKNATVTVKEKDGIIQGSAGAALPISQISEAKMNSTEALTEADRTEKTTFTGAIAKVDTGKDAEGKPISSEMLAISVQLRPKSDADLAKWKEKLSKGRPDGTYTYTFKNSYGVVDGNKAELAAAIVKNATNGSHGNTKLASGKTAHADDVKKALETKTYASGATVTFPVYRKETEMLWLEVSATGSKEHKKEFLKGEGAYFEIGKKCECEAKIRAFMRVIRIAEGTGEYLKGTNQARDPQLGYTTWYSGGGNNFSDLSTHPQKINCNKARTLCSSAAGAYQIMGWKFDELNGYLIEPYKGTYRTVKPLRYSRATDVALKYNAKGFSEIAQDRLAVAILKALRVTDSLLENNIQEAITKSKGTWVSLPGATAGQPTATLKRTLDYYDEFLKKELAGDSHLHIKKGFLQEFGISCNCNGSETTNAEWVNPLKIMALRGWYSDTQWSPEKSNYKGRTGGKHDGLDLYAPVGTPVYACVKGSLTFYESSSYGKTLTLEGKYNGKTYYFFYAHLSSIDVDLSKPVAAGQPIGKTGQTGNARTQPAKFAHLHFEVRSTAARTGGRLNPMATIKELQNINTSPDRNSQTGR